MPCGSLANPPAMCLYGCLLESRWASHCYLVLIPCAYHSLQALSAALLSAQDKVCTPCCSMLCLDCLLWYCSVYQHVTFMSKHALM